MKGATHGRSSSMWNVSDVMEVSIPSGVGYGFNVTTEGRKPLVLFAGERWTGQVPRDQNKGLDRSNREIDIGYPCVMAVAALF
jgi:hypothetical protein